MSISAKIGCTPQTLNGWVEKAEADGGRRAGIQADMTENRKALERENRELRQGEEGRKTVRLDYFPTNEALRKASAYSAMAELDRRSK